ncbi:MAG: DEAD/DEAH box helicase [Deltaproteobacteria bacterium]|nr:DEAD/DEAH box helicase [Deltaproteobacteria bacterium]MCB9786136.1 DEAD/DEAH box helicase [Deltaproteobacteria bacterium]
MSAAPAANPGLDALYELIRKATPPAEWSAGVKLARAGAVVGESRGDDEIELKVMTGRGVLALRVSLYPEDDDWTCDCDSRAAACQHVAACVIALRQAQDEGLELPAPEQPVGHVRYVLERSDRGLELHRQVVVDGATSPLRVSLTAAAAGQAEAPPVAIAAHDLDVEDALGLRSHGRIAREQMPRILRALASCGDVRLGEAPVRCSPHPVLPVVRVEDDGDGFLVTALADPGVEEVFANGAARLGDQVRPVGDPGVARELMWALSKGKRYGPTEVAGLVTEVLPELRRRLRVETLTRRLPGVCDEPPRAVVETREAGDRLLVEAQIVYGEPEVARVVDGVLTVRGEAVPARDEGAEERLARELRQDLGLVPGTPAVLDGEDAVRFATKLRAWRRGEVAGSAHEAFTLAAPLSPDLSFGDGESGFEVGFRSADGQADPGRVLAAWQRGSTLAPLDGGGWAPIPLEWLGKHGHLVADLLEARAADGSLPRAVLPDLARLCDAHGAPRPAALGELQRLVDGFDGLGRASLPDDLDATLRSYQREGVDWLSFMRDAGLGALLADDMGLGKTLQTLAVVRGRTLVVAPTSVLHSWRNEAQRFRPGLRTAVYHGPQRSLDPDADLVLTTYAILRLDADLLAAQRWDMVVLDEAQAIKNPESQVTRAAWRLDAAFKVTLTGTPVENRLDELWSQFQFIAPGLLGSRKTFQERTVRPIAEGLTGAAGRLRTRIRPFILRRLKRDVAKELPPRTEIVLRVELSDAERRVYDAIRAATQKEVAERLGQGGNPLQALEALMRLRQAACHSALIPGQHATSSSKVELLLEQLDEAVSEGHKALVFSQWTSYLDLVEPHLGAAGLGYCRLDGSTRDRQAVVDRFQAEDGPPVMLLSLKAGGTGLTLTAADHVFLLDPWWNPAVEDQAADRAHRIGQDRPVLVHRLVAEGTVEERILALQGQKRALADAALEGADRAAALTRDDLLALLA